jgi:hypothetical protein
MEEVAPARSEAAVPRVVDVAAVRVLQKEGVYDWDHVVRQWVEDRLDDSEDYFNAAKVEFATFSGRGRGLRAKENIARGTLLLVERPLVYQRIDRRLTGPTQPPPSLADLIAECARADPAVAKKLATLMNVKPSAVLADVVGMRRLSVSHGWTFHNTSVFEALRDQSGLYYRGSMMNHSCEPNTVPAFFGPVMVCFALADIGKGAEVTVPYCDIAKNFMARRGMLQKWNFECGCKRCVREESARQLDFLERLEDAYNDLRDQPGPLRLDKVANLQDSVRRVPGADFLLARVLLLGARAAQVARDKESQRMYLKALVQADVLGSQRAAESGTIVRECIYRGYVAERMAASDDDDDSDEWFVVARIWLTLGIFPDPLVEFTYRALRASFYQYKRKMEQQQPEPDDEAVEPQPAQGNEKK